VAVNEGEVGSQRQSDARCLVDPLAVLSCGQSAGRAIQSTRDSRGFDPVGILGLGFEPLSIQEQPRLVTIGPPLMDTEGGAIAAFVTQFVDVNNLPRLADTDEFRSRGLQTAIHDLEKR